MGYTSLLKDATIIEGSDTVSVVANMGNGASQVTNETQILCK